MIRTIDIQNFRVFERLNVPHCGRINIVVGDSGAGKTALLESMFLALGAHPSLALRIRAGRGLEGGIFHGNSRQIEEGMFGDLFFRYDTTKGLSIRLSGEGPVARSLFVSRRDVSGTRVMKWGDDVEQSVQEPLSFTWQNHVGNQNTIVPEVSSQGISFRGQDEAGLPESYFFQSSQNNSSLDNATRFSMLSRKKQEGKFVKLFTDQYSWIEGLGIEVPAGIPQIYATVAGIDEKLPVNVLSGAINRMLAILLGISSQPQAVILLDEIENGVYYGRHELFWRGIVDIVREQDSQIFVTTHSKEWLESCVVNAEDLSDHNLLRLERGPSGAATVQQFSGDDLRIALRYGEEVR